MHVSPAPEPSAGSEGWKPNTPLEKGIWQAILRRRPVARDVVQEFDSQATFGQRLADRVASFGGSWTFILLFLGFLGCWAVLNTEILGPRNLAFDPYPYIFLNLFLSMLAALQAPVIMMSQNRQSETDRLQAAHDYEVNLKAELEIRELHTKFDLLREQEWANLVRLQQEQIRLLTRLLGQEAEMLRTEGQVDGPQGAADAATRVEPNERTDR